MYFWDIIFYFITGLCLISSMAIRLTAKNARGKVIFAIHFLPAVISLFHILLFNLSYFAIPVYISALMLILAFIVRYKKIISPVLLILALAIFSLPMISQLSLNYQNYSSMSYTEAFKAMNSFIKSRYPFQEYKRLDLDGKYQYYLGLFEKADKDRNKKEYYMALKEYLNSFHDGHVFVLSLMQSISLSYADNFAAELKSEYIGGSYGFSVIQTDDGRAVVSLVGEGSNAEKLGIKQGTVITKWNGKPVKDAVEGISTLWNLNGVATLNHAYRLKYAYLTMAPVGKEASISYINEDNTEKTVNLKAEKNNSDLLEKNLTQFYHGSWLEENQKEMESSVLEGGYGYMRIRHFSPAGKKEEMAFIDQFKSTIEDFKKRNVKALILDLRNNAGGSDDLAATILGFLSDKEIYYECENVYDAGTKSLVKTREIISKPDYLGFSRNIIVLANQNTISAGEGFVFNARKLPGVKTAGITETNGSFGTMKGGIVMPGNYMVAFPRIACCDEEGKIMIDSDYTGEGGVQPDIRIPFDLNAVLEIFQKDRDYELEYIISKM